MKIKRSSWHYKISNFDRYVGRNDNLCSYVQRLVFKFIVGTFLSVAVIGLSVVFIHAIITDPIFRNLLLFLVSSIALPTLAIYYLRKVLGKSPEIPGSNILIEYLKAKKDKLCHMIEYID